MKWEKENGGNLLTTFFFQLNQQKDNGGRSIQKLKLNQVGSSRKCIQMMFPAEFF